MSSPSESSAPVITVPLAPTPPHWVREYLTREQPPPLTLLTSNIPNATALSAAGLSDAVADAYRRLLSEMQAEARHAVRIWNFVPSIQGELGAGDRYMAFNAGRFAAFSEAFGLANETPAAIPTASAVGIDGTMLWIHVLAAGAPGVPLENPRQVPAYRYSERYGLRPPCFARATKFESTLFIGGTASIIGEDSRHAAAIVAQTDETLANLRALIAAATGMPLEHALQTLRDVRVHVTSAMHTPVVRGALEQVVSREATLEFVEAQLCRRELLVEIEGVATCGRPSGRPNP
jgi:chorismate lyase/3-hydroxybenzoate synthase